MRVCGARIACPGRGIAFLLNTSAQESSFVFYHCDPQLRLTYRQGKNYPAV
jgi:hypothetical protein